MALPIGKDVFASLIASAGYFMQLVCLGKMKGCLATLKATVKCSPTVF
jgi:hypothetical protein